MYIDHRQSNWSEWLAAVKFIFNNKIHIVTKSLLFKVNYGWELRTGFEIRKNRKNVKMEKFVIEIKKMYEKAKVTLKKSQKKMKKYTDMNRKEAVEYIVGDIILLSTKNLIWQIRNRKIKKLIEKFVRSYKIKKIISGNTVKLKLLVLIKIYLVVNVSRIAIYQK